MDRSDVEQDNRNMDPSATSSADAVIPTYQLYGDISSARLSDWMHCESIAERSCLYDWEIRPHRHETFFQILYIESGGGEALLNNAHYVIAAPCVILVPAMSVHGFRFSDDVCGLVVTMPDARKADVIGANSRVLEQLSEARQVALTSNSADAVLLSQLFACVAREFNGTAVWRMEAIRASLTVAIVVAVRSLTDRHSRQHGAPNSKSAHIRNFRDFVDRDYRSQKRIGYYASKLGISATQLNRLCREVLGKSAFGVLSSRLILEAERDLIYTGLEVKAIALSLGFTDPAYFARFFSKSTGQTPTEFRRIGRVQFSKPLDQLADDKGLPEGANIVAD